MRIIAGEHRGRHIAAPPGDGTRPMLDRVREALFSTLGNLVEGARILDLFAGSGSLGLEGLSRGALVAQLVEKNREAFEALRANVAALGLEDRACLVRGNALSPEVWRPKAPKKRAQPPAGPKETVGTVETPVTPGATEPEAPEAAIIPNSPDCPNIIGGFDLVFFDPPYAMVEDPMLRVKLIAAMEALLDGIVRPGGVLVFHAPSQKLETMRFARGRKSDLRTYGGSALLYVFKDSGRGAGEA